MEYALYQAISFCFRPFMSSNNTVQLRRHGISHVETYEITSDELDQIERAAGDIGLDFQVAEFCLTLALSFLAGILLSPPPADRLKTFILFVVIIVVGLLVGGIFLIKWFQSRSAFSTVITKIRQRQLGPLGESGAELRQSQLEELPSEKGDAGQ